MYSCYILSLVTIACLMLAFIQSFSGFPVFKAGHVTFMILTGIIYAFAETLVIFFFVGTGISIRDYTKDHRLPPAFHQRSIAVKRKVYPPLTLNMLFMIILFVIVGAVDTGRVPKWIYQTFFIFCIADYLRIKIIQNECFRDNTAIILEMSGMKT
ncbi:MAG: hypothetical protein COW13_01920 [Candidatus Omnitrophica bacterium CG12_big_fil_rev_8_21_14_0_65_50_5]|nr:MAG: hypothetical protein COW13_01920 [Candidatus Omnitrophica bacterium CG12_big_fil_rev_8_21_14_0_65_50_5]